MASKVKVDTIEQQGSSGIVITDDIKLSSGKAIKNASGTALLGEDGALGSGVTATANHGAVKTAINASGDAPIFACRAWVNFSGIAVDGSVNLTGVRGSQNVASLVDQGTGMYTVNFTTALAANYAIAGLGKQAEAPPFIMAPSDGTSTNATDGHDAMDTGSCRITCVNYNSAAEYKRDGEVITLVFFST